MRIINIALLGSGFVAEFFMQGLANVNGQRVVVNYSRSRKHTGERYGSEEGRGAQRH